MNTTLENKDCALTAAQQKITNLESLISAKSEELKRLRSQRDYHKEKAEKISQKLELLDKTYDDNNVELQTALDTLDNMKKESIEASETIKMLEDHIKRLESQTIKTEMVKCLQQIFNV